MHGPRGPPRVSPQPLGAVVPIVKDPSARNAITLIAISARVTIRPRLTVVTDRIVLTRVRWRAHSGQRIPTGVGVMQSGQIGRAQFEHDTPVSRDGCR